jgi:hypothetical protein
MPIIPALGLRQKNHEFNISLGYIESSMPAWTIYETLSQKKKKMEREMENIRTNTKIFRKSNQKNEL